jgi:hypothetical protein
MMEFFVSSGSLIKEVEAKTPKEAAIITLKQWAECGQCNLGLAILAGDIWFLTESLLTEINIPHKKNTVIKSCHNCLNHEICGNNCLKLNCEKHLLKKGA